MKTIEIIGYNRANLGKTESRRIRQQGHVPCVLYGGEKQVHFYSPAILFRPLIYTREAYFVNLNVDGVSYRSILQDIQFHPVSEIILHIDFLQIQEDRKIKMNIPTHLVGQSPGVTKGGALVQKRRSLKVLAFPKDVPSHIDVDCSSLDFHHTIKVKDMHMDNILFIDPKQASIAVVEVPRSAKLANISAAAASEQQTEEPITTEKKE